MTRTLLAFTACALLLSGCSGIFPYQNHLEKNLSVRTKTDSGSLFTSIKARVDVYTVDDACQLTYQGSVDLDRKEVPIGLPQNRKAYLDFIFSHSGFLSSRKGSTGFDVYFTTRHGFEYVAEAHYTEGIYDVVLKERKKGRKKMRELGYGECTPK